MADDEKGWGEFVPSILGILSALVVGVPLWYFFVMFFGASNPFGKADGQSNALLFAPIVGLAVPFAGVMSERAPGLAAWSLALAPLLSIANFAAAIFMSVHSTSKDDTPLMMFTVIWIVPFVVIVGYALFRRPKAGADKPGV